MKHRINCCTLYNPNANHLLVAFATSSSANIYFADVSSTELTLLFIIPYLIITYYFRFAVITDHGKFLCANYTDCSGNFLSENP